MRPPSFMRLKNCLFVGCLSLMSLPAVAETVNNLYQVREPVSGQTPDEKTRATQAALETLVIRLTGDPKAVQNGGLAEVRKDPQQIISQYGYDAGPPESLQVDFDPASTERVMRQAGLPLWGTNRPVIMAWWLNDATDGANLVGDGQASAEPLRRAAQHRGLPLRLPLADLGEQGIGNAKTLDGNNVGPLKEASERYGSDAILAVHAQENGGQWQGKWHLWLGDKMEQGSASGASPADLADAVLLAVSQRLAPRFVVKPGASTGMVLDVQGMNLERYAQLLRLLEPFGGRLKSAEGDHIAFDVSGSPDQLRSQLALAKLQEVPASEIASAPINPVPGAADGAPVPAQPPAVSPTALHFRW
jgi:hypothetical protein